METQTKINPEYVVKRYLDALNRRDMDAVATSLEPNYVTDIAYFGKIMGREANIRYERNLYKACPDSQDSIVSLVSHSEMVVGEFLTSGTLTGPFETPRGTIPPTGRHFEFKSAVFYRVNSTCLIEEKHEYVDAASLFKQLGLNAGKLP